MGEVIEVGVDEFQHDLASYIEKVGQGQTVVVMREGRAVGRLIPPEPPPAEASNLMPWGVLAGKGYWIGPDFDDPLPDDMLDAMENGQV